MLGERLKERVKAKEEKDLVGEGWMKSWREGGTEGSRGQQA